MEQPFPTPPLPKLELANSTSDSIECIDSNLEAFITNNNTTVNIIEDILHSILISLESINTTIGDIGRYLYDNIRPVSEEEKRESERYAKVPEEEKDIEVLAPGFLQKLFGSVILITTAILATIAGFVEKYLKDTMFASIGDRARRTTKSIINMERLLEYFKPVLNFFKQIRLFFTKVWQEKIWKPILSAMNKLQKVTSRAIKPLSSTIQLISEFFYKIKQGIPKPILNMLGKFNPRQWISSYFQSVTDLLSAPFRLVGNLFKSSTGVLKWITPYKNIVKEKFFKFGGYMASFFKKILAPIIAIVDGIKAFIKTEGSILDKVWAFLETSLSKYIQLVWTSLLEFGSWILSYAISIPYNIVSWAIEKITGYDILGITTAAEWDVLEAFKQFTKSFIDIVNEYVSETLGGFIGWVSDFFLGTNFREEARKNRSLIDTARQKQEEGINISDESIEDIGKVVSRSESPSIHFHENGNVPYEPTKPTYSTGTITRTKPKTGTITKAVEEKSIAKKEEIFTYIRTAEGKRIGVTYEEFMEKYGGKEIEAAGGTVTKHEPYDPYKGNENLKKQRAEEDLAYIQDALDRQNVEMSQERQNKIRDVYGDIPEAELNQLYLELEKRSVNQSIIENNIRNELGYGSSNKPIQNNNAVVNNYNTTNTVVPAVANPYINDASTISSIRDSMISN